MIFPILLYFSLLDQLGFLQLLLDAFLDISNMKKKKIQCSCGEIFKDESFASAEKQFIIHKMLMASGGKLSNQEHEILKEK